jgi:hypothetical protein
MSEPAEGRTEELLREYRDTLVEMHQNRVEVGGNPRRWNRLVDQAQALHLLLRETPEGRAGITRLISDDNPTVRQWSAGNALAWDEQTARAELERLAAEPQGLGSLEAKITLREFDAGRLDTTWHPKGGRS